jgi:multidrug efflux pump subunit AcrB
VVVGIATILAGSLFATKTVRVKLLPFDNKSELQVVVDLPEGATLEATERVLIDAAAIVTQMPEVIAADAYAGTASPFNFNGLVRHYYLRNRPELGDLQVGLKAKDARGRSSHAIALDMRERLKGVSLPDGATMKVVEVPPGPPVISTLLAEIYGPDAQTRRAVAGELRKIFASIPYIVDIDDSFGIERPRQRLTPDRTQIEFFGVEESDVMAALNATLNGEVVGYSHRGEGRNPIEIAVRLPQSARTWSAGLAAMPVAAASDGSRLISMGELIRAEDEKGSYPIFRRDARNLEMVMADLAGAYESPIYGMLDVATAVDQHDWGGLPKPAISYYGQPSDESKPTLLWDGEWEITYVTFRDIFQLPIS